LGALGSLKLAKKNGYFLGEGARLFYSLGALLKPFQTPKQATGAQKKSFLH